MNVSQILAEFVSGLRAGGLPKTIGQDVNIRIMDFVSSAVAGSRVNHGMNGVAMTVLGGQGGNPQSSLLFQREKLPAAHAAFYNAFVANGADMDDGHMLANGHPGVTVIPPVLALAQWRGIGYGDMAAAIAAGYDVYIRISKAIMPSHLQRGFNGTGTVGAIAGAAAASRVLGLDAGKTHHAIGLAATSGAGLMEFNASGQAMKPINPGNAAYRGVFCALLAEAGAVGPAAPLDGARGFFSAFADEVDTKAVTQGLGEEFLLDSSYIKLYPVCRHTHAMIDCAAHLHNEGGFAPDEIERIILYTYPSSEKLTGLIRHPKSGDEAKFSLTYSAAVSLLSANFTLGDLDAAVHTDPQVTALINRMDIVVEPGLEDRSRMIRGARMQLVLSSGETRDSAVDVPKGEKQFPLTQADMRRKLAACAEGVFSPQQQDRIFDATMQLEMDGELGSYFAMLAEGK